MLATVDTNPSIYGPKGLTSTLLRSRSDRISVLNVTSSPPTALYAVEARYSTTLNFFADLTAVPLLIIDDLGMRKLPHTAAEDLLEIIMRRYERASTLLTSNRPVDDWGKLLGDTAAVTALLDRLLHHAHVLKCGPRSWRTKIQTDLRTEDATK